MKILATALVFTALAGVCYAQESQAQLNSGLAAMSAAQNQNEAQAEATQEAQEQAQAQAEARYEERQAAIQRQAAADAAAAAENARNEKFQDQERQLAMMQQQIELEKEQTDANRENDKIDAQLRAENAQSNVAQSVADFNKILAIGQAWRVPYIGWGTWIRTKAARVRARSSTARTIPQKRRGAQLALLVTEGNSPWHHFVSPPRRRALRPSPRISFRRKVEAWEPSRVGKRLRATRRAQRNAML